ncbi:MAG: YkgJ family cysteine cluster protein [Syntrophobacteraceae bacterium]
MQNPKLYKTGRLKGYLRKKNPKAAGSFVLKNLCDPAFPLYFLLRNLNWLEREKWWRELSPRSRRVHAARLLIERIAIFGEVKRWKKRRDYLRHTPRPSGGKIDAPGYCNKCGLCCEVASGMPDFPESCRIPGKWRTVFGNGLGQGHRFCPFLWEDNGSGGSLCSIYPWRSNPCRLFESDECDFFWNNPEPVEIASEKNLLLMRRWLANLVNGRKLPLAAPDVAAKGPEFLEFDRV